LLQMITPSNSGHAQQPSILGAAAPAPGLGAAPAQSTLGGLASSASAQLDLGAQGMLGQGSFSQGTIGALQGALGVGAAIGHGLLSQAGCGSQGAISTQGAISQGGISTQGAIPQGGIPQGAIPPGPIPRGAIPRGTIPQGGAISQMRYNSGPFGTMSHGGISHGMRSQTDCSPFGSLRHGMFSQGMQQGLADGKMSNKSNAEVKKGATQEFLPGAVNSTPAPAPTRTSLGGGPTTGASMGRYFSWEPLKMPKYK